MMTDITDFRGLVAADHGLVVVSTLRADGSVQSTVVNAGVLPHPVGGHEVVAFVIRGGTRKLANLRERPRATVTIRAGWQWVTAEGPVELAGPADPLPGLGPEDLRWLLRDVFTAAGGEHDDWADYDRAMASEGRTAVLLTPDRVYSNP
ncbi:hypothetical protein Airi01_025410 [Actinoallomurus iriomotensis]|uniref:Pyridoxamine 5'-phosphate oxidase N-terminal domain-containing protein n=2 Tax=Actinoallomurus iriomotensis TaxID=478107 RepID=A0A9W6VNZ5_9ACTN|nr:hypothetical protein Airi01_025410 [Actinoallomurus iriomotensis]